MFNTKAEVIAALQEELGLWEELLKGRTEQQITTRDLPGGWSLKDVIAHLRMWQQRTMARLEAAAKGGEPILPSWPADLNPSDEADLEALNTWMYESNRDRPWAEIYAEWRAGFVKVLELAEQIPEQDLLQSGRYAWLPDHALIDVLQGTYEHHREEHREGLEGRAIHE